MNLKRKRDNLFRFVIYGSVEATNNRAERAIRPIATCRKVSGIEIEKRCWGFRKGIFDS